MDQARARDAVHRPFDPVALADSLGLVSTVVRSRARSLAEHLLRPDLGRQAHPEDLSSLVGTTNLVAVVADGLSSGAVERYVPRLLAALPEKPSIVFVPFGRVAIGDHIGAALGAELVVVLLGERPGLSDPESLGAYVTYEPYPGRTDADRVCLSNIRDGGTPPEEAAERLAEVLAQARFVKGTGVLFPPTHLSMLE
jgi:ethanolamine ammonia-lyase small subunit